MLMYECLNLVAEPDGHAGCVLIRALQPIRGIESMFRRRPAARKIGDLASGPGKLTLAMNITRAHNGCDGHTADPSSLRGSGGGSSPSRLTSRRASASACEVRGLAGCRSASLPRRTPPVLYRSYLLVSGR